MVMKLGKKISFAPTMENEMDEPQFLYATDTELCYEIGGKVIKGALPSQTERLMSSAWLSPELREYIRQNQPKTSP